ncbi:FecCD family ABC transporter permease [Algisphaera agarilytica]|uniref:Iron complex transport system permease protein n=1 Tax=Algisphaera agarilytica TaxID=1385975 RepID=A0A7X0LLS9_9BACT|nr:iron ABC transporter permease [Algisphaera agarilytica]MBB6431234.1 iron complex transport system permease protein [Algisphaera agarilytica]
MTTRDRPSDFKVLAALLGVFLLAAALRLLIGTSSLGLPGGDAGWEVLALRGDRLVTASLVGAALAVAGVALQALLRNPLAEPFILGLSTGAAAGMVGQRLLAAALGVSLGFGFGGAALGAGVCMMIVYLASQRHGVLDPLGLLLTGVVLSTISGALIMLAVHLRPDLLRVELSQWMMGYLSEDRGAVVSWGRGLLDRDAGWRVGLPWVFFVVAGIFGLGLGYLLRQAKAMDLATLSSVEARALGVNLHRLRRGLFGVSCLLAAGAVVLAGPIAFVGLVCPHVARLLVGPRHRGLLWSSALLGATLVILADTVGAELARRLGVGVVPLGVFTAIVGGGAFLWMLRPHLGRGVE